MPFDTGHRLWAITCFFNPTASPQRLANYRAFRKSLTAPLVTVELAYGPKHQLCADDSEILIRLRGTDVLWQKERLLNLALNALPADCDSVAWLDCDVLFERDDWANLVCGELERHVLVQPFHEAIDLGPDGQSLELTPRRSLAYTIASGSRPAHEIATARLRNEWGCAAGLAWAARRDVLTRHGLYDAGIVGGGDRAIACAAWGAWRGLERTHVLNEAQLRHYQNWADPFFADVRDQVGAVKGAVFHLWHGSLQKRGYGTRFTGLAPFGFDPEIDIALDDQGCWRWHSDKPEMHEYVRRYFELRAD